MVTGIRNGGMRRNQAAEDYRDPNQYMPQEAGTRQQVQRQGREMGFDGQFGGGAFQNWLREQPARQTQWEGDRMRRMGGTPGEAYMNTAMPNGLTNRQAIQGQRDFGYNGRSDDRSFRSWLNQTGQTSRYGDHIQKLVDDLNKPAPAPETTPGSEETPIGEIQPWYGDDEWLNQGRA